MRLRFTFIPALIILGWTAHAFMQQEDTPVKLRADTRVVQIDVTVRDSLGRAVNDLKASDFSVTDNGNPRSFTIFSLNADKPQSPKVLPRPRVLPPNVFSNADAAAIAPDGHSTIILLDGENGWPDNFEAGRKGVIGLLAKLPADEKIAVYVLRNGAGLGILQDYTLDRDQVKAAVAKFRPPDMKRSPSRVEVRGAQGGCTALAEMRTGGGVVSGDESMACSANPIPSPRYNQSAMRTASEDVRLALNGLAQKLRSVPGRKSVFWISQGFPPSEIRGETNWDKTLATLNDANIAVNTVDSNGLGGPLPFWGGRVSEGLERIAEATGGQAFSNRNDLDVAMASGVAASRSSYTLGFYLTEVDGKFHALKVSVDRPNLELNYRQGYYAQTETVKNASSKKSSLQEALLNPAALTDVRMTATLHTVPGQPRGTIRTRLVLDSEPLSMEPAGSGFNGKVEELFLEQDAGGREVARYSDTKKLSVSAANKAKFDAEGAVFSQTLPLEASAVRVSIIVRDTASGRMGSLVIPLDKVTPQK